MNILFHGWGIIPHYWIILYKWFQVLWKGLLNHWAIPLDPVLNIKFFSYNFFLSFQSSLFSFLMTFWLKVWGTSQFVVQVQDEIHANLSEFFICGHFHDPTSLRISVILLLQSAIIKVITMHNLPHLTWFQSHLQFNFRIRTCGEICLQR